MANGSVTSSYARGFITSSLPKWGGGLIGYMIGYPLVEAQLREGIRWELPAGFRGPGREMTNAPAKPPRIQSTAG